MIILIIHIIVSYDQNILLIFYVNDGSHVRLRHPSCVYISAQRQYTTVLKMCALLKWLSLPYILAMSQLSETIITKHYKHFVQNNKQNYVIIWKKFFNIFFKIQKWEKILLVFYYYKIKEKKNINWRFVHNKIFKCIVRKNEIIYLLRGQIC